MHNRFGNPEKHQADPHACGKQHGKPGCLAIFWLTMVRPEFNFPHIGQGNINQDNQEDRHGEDIKPAK